MARKVEVVPYDPAWPERFRAEAERLRAVFGAEAVAIHHFGSTAVPGLSAKPIIDLLVEVRDLDRVETYNDAMRALGYESFGEYGIAGRRFFPRSVDEARTHHVHVYQRGSAEVERHLTVRDYLSVHTAEAAAYARLKQGLALQHPWDASAYQAGKGPFVDELERRALAWGNARAQSIQGPRTAR